MCATRTTYENFALKSRYVFPPLLKSKLPRHNGLFETGTRGTRTLFPFPGDRTVSNFQHFSPFSNSFQTLSSQRERERAFYFSKRCIKGCTFRGELPFTDDETRGRKRFRLSIGSPLSFREEYTLVQSFAPPIDKR